MKYFEIGYPEKKLSFDVAMLQGLGDHGGLFMPEKIPPLGSSFISEIENFSDQQIAVKVLEPFLEGVLTKEQINGIASEALDFNIPVIKLNDEICIMELFHGPTHAFKDVGARFLARLMSEFKEEEPLTILVATSGDTGSAVANGFWKVPGIDVIILFPKGGISPYQESQMTTLGENITALEIEGVFDDCQKLVKEAFNDENLRTRKTLSSANSINIARLLPQVIYYFIGYKKLSNKEGLVISVPSGNFGNITAGMIAWKMGLPVKKWIASTNANKVFPEYLKSGEYIPAASLKTYSNAMDVGDPSNFERLLHVFGNDFKSIKEYVDSYSISDEETIETIKEVYQKYNYVMDPHTAVGYRALLDSDFNNAMIVSTAHPSKFTDVVRKAVPDYEMEFDYDITNSKKIPLSKNYEDFKRFLLS